MIGETLKRDAVVLLPALLGMLGLAVPLNLAAQVSPKEHPQTDTAPSTQRVRPYTGMLTGGKASIRIVGNTVVTGDDPDVIIMQVEPGSPAEAAGLREGDVILEVGGVDVHSGEVSPLASLATGVSYLLRVRRAEQELELTLVPGPLRPVPRVRGHR